MLQAFHAPTLEATIQLPLRVCKAIHFTSYQPIRSSEVTELHRYPSMCVYGGAHYVTPPFWFFNLAVAYVLCIWHSVQAQLASTRTYAVKKHQTQVKVAEGKVSDVGRKGGGSPDWCCGWLLSLYNPTHLPLTNTHTHTLNPFHPPFSLLCPLVIQPPLLPPRCSETMWMRSRTWGAHRRENRCHMPLAPRSGMCVCSAVTGSVSWLKGKAGALIPVGNGMKWGPIRGGRGTGIKRNVWK